MIKAVLRLHYLTDSGAASASGTWVPSDEWVRSHEHFLSIGHNLASMDGARRSISAKTPRGACLAVWSRCPSTSSKLCDSHCGSATSRVGIGHGLGSPRHLVSIGCGHSTARAFLSALSIDSKPRARVTKLRIALSFGRTKTSRPRTVAGRRFGTVQGLGQKILDLHFRGIRPKAVSRLRCSPKKEEATLPFPLPELLLGSV